MKATLDQKQSRAAAIGADSPVGLRGWGAQREHAGSGKGNRRLLLERLDALTDQYGWEAGFRKLLRECSGEVCGQLRSGFMTRHAAWLGLVDFSRRDRAVVF